MNVLAIDSSMDLSIYGLMSADKFVSGLSLNFHHDQLKELIPTIDSLLTKNSLKINDIDLFIVGIGPGSWTGIRVCVTTIKTIAHALNKPIVSINALDLIASNIKFSPYPVYSIIDATRDEVYYAQFDCSNSVPYRETEYQIASIRSLVETILAPSIFIGDGVQKYKEQFEQLHNKNIIFSFDAINLPKPSFLIDLGIAKFKLKGAENVFNMTPLYFQKTSAEQIWELKNSAL